MLIARVLLATVVVTIVARLVGTGLGRVGQPPVLGEILAGLLLGPSVLGALPGHLSSGLFPAAAMPWVRTLGTVGLVAFLFSLGLEFEPAPLRRRRTLVGAVATGALVLPFAAGVAVAVALYAAAPGLVGHHVREVPFTLFVATAFSITAFPVLARIVADHDLAGTEVGMLSVACAAVMDTAGWVLLAVDLVVVSARGPGGVLLLTAEAAAPAAVLLALLRPLVRRLMSDREAAGPRAAGWIVLTGGLAGSALGAQAIGLHPAIGAFAFGLAVPGPDRRRLGGELRASLPGASCTVLLPLYFVAPGLVVNLRALGPGAWWQLGLVTVAASGGKLLGAFGPARACGLPRGQAATLAVLINTRGLVELVVITVGLSRGVISHEGFGVLLGMALFTTLAAGPLLAWLAPGADRRDAPVLGMATN